MAPLSQEAPRQEADEESGARPRIWLERTAVTSPPRWHADRHRAILREEPEVARLFGVDRASAGWVGAVVVTQLVVAVAMHGASWWLVVGGAVIVGAPMAHALGVLIHECSHNLVFRRTWSNRPRDRRQFCRLARPRQLNFATSISCTTSHLGDARRPDGEDTQAPTRREVLATRRVELEEGRLVCAPDASSSAVGKPIVRRWTGGSWRMWSLRWP